MKIELYPPLSVHEIGLRENQEDSIIQWDNRLFVLCDGMGGHEKGEVASQLVCQSLATWFENNIIPEKLFSDDQLREAIEYAYTELDKYADGNPRQMGTTLTLLYIGSKGITAAHMGDSRIYLLRNGVLTQISKDQTLAMKKYEANIYTLEEAERSLDSHKLTSFLGVDYYRQGLSPQLFESIAMQDNDKLLLCSDGLYDELGLQDIQNVMLQNPDRPAFKLVQAALNHGGNDNVTCAVIERV